MNEEEVVGGVLGQDPDPNNIFAHDMMDHDDHDGAAVEAFQVSESLITDRFSYSANFLDLFHDPAKRYFVFNQPFSAP